MNCSSSQVSERGGITTKSASCVECPHPWNAPRYFCFTQRAVWRRACLLSACCCPMRSNTLPGSSTCLPWSCSRSAPVGDCFVCEVGLCFIQAHFLFLLHEALVVVGSPALLSHTDVGLAVRSPIWAHFPCQTEMYPHPARMRRKLSQALDLGMVSSSRTLLEVHFPLLFIPIGPTQSQINGCLLRLLRDSDSEGALMPVG